MNGFPSQTMRYLGLLVLSAVALQASACAHARSALDHPASPPRAVAELPGGARIRYVIRGDWRGIRTGRVARASTDTVWLESGRTLAVAQLRRLDVSRGGGPSEHERLAWGAVLGAAVGGVAGAVPASENAGHQAPSSRAGRAGLGAGMGAVLGGLAGLLFWPGEQWEAVARPVRGEP